MCRTKSGAKSIGDSLGAVIDYYVDKAETISQQAVDAGAGRTEKSMRLMSEAQDYVSYAKELSKIYDKLGKYIDEVQENDPW